MDQWYALSDQTGSARRRGRFFHAWVWPGPLIFSLTDDSLKTDFTAPFSNEGKQQVVDWINVQYEDHPEKWSHEKKNLY